MKYYDTRESMILRGVAKIYYFLGGIITNGGLGGESGACQRR